MPFSLFWTTGILGSCSCDWSINAPATFYNSTCLVIHASLWKGTKGQSMIACPSSSQNTYIFENNMNTSKSTYSWSHVWVVYLVWLSFKFPWCERVCDILPNTFAYASACFQSPQSLQEHWYWCFLPPPNLQLVHSNLEMSIDTQT